MDLDTLNLLVSEAILRAEALSDLGAPGAAAAHLDVSMLEEKIAVLTSASTAQGALARQGAVGAAVLAGHPERAARLAGHFCGDPGATDEFCNELSDVLTRLTGVATSAHLQAIARGFPRASARYGAEAIVLLAEAIARQAEPLPIS